VFVVIGALSLVALFIVQRRSAQYVFNAELELEEKGAAKQEQKVATAKPRKDIGNHEYWICLVTGISVGEFRSSFQ
jgi:hypothetical protein